jgi:crotonobetainyl-CoA:carnitine CoA-transferase CaiB-like acyl-CoA transferase
MSPHATYKSQGDDNAWVSIAVGTEDEWHALCRAIGQPALATDARFATPELRKRHERELDEIVTSWTETRDRWEITETLQAAGVAAYPSMSNRDLVEDPHLNDRQFFVTLDHPAVGRRAHAGIPWKMSSTPCQVRSPAPMPGADTDQVLASLLGLSSADIELLRADGVVQ